jgi:hypothetical protein
MESTRLVACWLYSEALTLKMGVIGHCEMSVSFYQITQRHIPEYSKLHSHLRMDLK